MGSIRINGDTSGYVELAAPAVAGSTVITLPLSDILEKDPATSQSITAGASGTTPLIVKGTSGQTANLFEARDNSNSTVFHVTPDGVMNSVGIYSPGVAVQSVKASSSSNQTIVSASPVALTGLSVTITPKFSNSLILIQGMVTASWTYVSSIHVFRNGVDIVPNHGSNSQSGGATALWTHYQSSQESDRRNQLFPFPVLYWDNPGTTSATTYDFRANSGWSGGTETFFLNNRTGGDMLSVSTILVTEIAQ